MTTVVFGATWACPACALRFARRRACPECGSAHLVSLGVGDLRRPPPWPFVVALAAVVAGVVWGTTAFAIGACVAVALFFALRRGSPKRLRVHVPPAVDEDALRGVARIATVEIPSAVGHVPCLVFGLCGRTDGAAIADADGGDFDIELPSGERVLVSLEHAVLVAAEDPTPAEHAVEGDLHAFFAQRGIVDRTSTVAEIVLRAGDPVTVSGKCVGAAIALGPGRARVVAGDEDAPLTVRIG